MTDERKEGYGTDIKLEDLNIDLFKLLLEQLIYLLRVKTAIGCTYPMWNINRKDIKVTLKFIDINGVVTDTEVQYGYLLPIDDFDKKIF